ncbi:glycogen/starch/alpha-glucan phosphorylase [Porcincola intestinalis]|uniref:glycogen/starch/alpha-glucan phosphorylase n=1 Tax=Porcincola intestinalis TaxID=2606632 RepID=UPI002A90FC93|nr:glycogen/starch/alpha-glucan phosphorylase [Porcincola intestinalis]MDY5580096.1 glycogen/starch/alpha-glucan phosphorylase [Porcincola intestinalis]
MSELESRLAKEMGKSVREASNEELYKGLLAITQAEAEKKLPFESKKKKKIYYLSAEFLIGKLLSNNLINLGLFDEARELLEKNGKDITAIEEIEEEPSLGNGGLGRLASCFLDSIATLNLNGCGVGLNYHLGLFRQEFVDHQQKAEPNPWLKKSGWEVKTSRGYDVTMAGKTYHSTLYDLYVTGYESETIPLHLFDLDTVDETIVHDGIDFDKKDIAKNLTLFLYPDDSDDDGRKLRIYQQYFMVSNGAQLILDECVARGSNLHDLADYAVFQINDTHPTMIIPEMIRLLEERGIGEDEAIAIVSKCAAYTNHTILAEALEKWPISYLKEIVPQLVPIIEALDDRVRRKYDDPSVVIIDKNDTVHMAHIDIHYGKSVNGVAKLHTEILEQTELRNFYNIYPEKFNNKTNGITFRRWLLSCNPELGSYIAGKIGNDFIRHAEKLEEFGKYADDEQVLNDLMAIKSRNKARLAKYLKDTRNIEIDPDSIFDIQAKRLHEYKRQQMNLLWCIHHYLDLRRKVEAGQALDDPKVTVLFAAKAAPAYIIAQDIIHAILCLQDIIEHDPEVSKVFRVVMVDNYNITVAEKLIPACDLSEQISLASKEASGTGNMKYMLNGAVTIGTEDGANVEIHNLVGDDNIYIFGMRSPEVISHYEKADYVSRDWYNRDAVLREAVDYLTGSRMMETGNAERLNRLKNELLNKDWFMTFPDFEAYSKIREQAYRDYADRKAWEKKCLINISKAGYFSSDRTIEEYNRDIWQVQ